MKKPISKDFKITLLSVLKKGSMTGNDRDRIETYLKTYFDGYTPPPLPPLSSEEMAALIDIEGLTIEEVAEAYEKSRREKSLFSLETSDK